VEHLKPPPAGVDSIPPPKKVNGRTITWLRSVGALSARERAFLLSEMMQVKGLLPLLMKPRNKQRWSDEDKAALAVHLRRLSKLSPYLVIVAMPGGFFMLPALAWWLDRRRNRTADSAR
jgi:hypothetical protein